MNNPYKFKTPMGGLQHFHAGTEQHAMVRARLIQRAWQTAMIMAESEVGGLCGHAVLDEKPWEQFNPEGRTPKQWIENMLDCKFEKFVQWIGGFDTELAERWKQGVHQMTKRLPLLAELIDGDRITLSTTRGVSVVGIFQTYEAGKVCLLRDDGRQMAIFSAQITSIVRA